MRRNAPPAPTGRCRIVVFDNEIRDRCQLPNVWQIVSSRTGVHTLVHEGATHRAPLQIAAWKCELLHADNERVPYPFYVDETRYVDSGGAAIPADAMRR